MLNKSVFFYNYFFNSKNFNKNIKNARKNYKLLKLDIKNFNIPFLHSFEKNYSFDFSTKTITHQKVQEINSFILLSCIKNYYDWNGRVDSRHKNYL